MFSFRFLANEFWLAGKTNVEKAQADEVVDAITDLQNAAVNMYLVYKLMFYQFILVHSNV